MDAGLHRGVPLFLLSNLVLILAPTPPFLVLAGILQGFHYIGSPIAGRTRRELEGLIGFFVNTLALRRDCSGEPTFRELVGRVRGVALEAYAHQEVPFERLVEELRPERSLGWAPVVQVMFVLQDADRAPLQLSGLAVSPVRVGTGTAKFDLSMSVTEGPEGLEVRLQYDTALFEGATIERLLGHYERLLAGAWPHQSADLTASAAHRGGAPADPRDLE